MNARVNRAMDDRLLRRDFGIRTAHVAAWLLILCSCCAPLAAQQEAVDHGNNNSQVSAVRQTSGAGTENATLRLAPSVQLSYDSGLHEFHLRGDRTTLIREVLGAFGITALVSNVGNQGVLRFDTQPVDFIAASEMIRLATASLIVPIDSTRVLVASDTKQNRESLVRLPTEVLYLPALSAAEMQDVVNIAKNIFDVKQVSLEPGSNTVVVRATATTLQALNETLVDLLAGQSEIALNVRLYETDRSRSVSAGVQLPQSSTIFNVDSELNTAIKQNATAVNEIISSGLASADDTLGIAAILVEEGLVTGVLSEPFALFGGGLTETGLSFGTLTADLMLSSSETRQLQEEVVKVTENEAALIKIGSRYPIETSIYTGAYYSSSGKVSSSTTPQIAYEDIGLNLKCTPHLEGNGRVHLAIDMKVQALAGRSVNGLPVLTSRRLVSQTTVAEGVSTTLTSILIKTASGTLDQLPGIGVTNTARTGQDDVEQFTIVITPYLVRRRHAQASSRVMLLTAHE